MNKRAQRMDERIVAAGHLHNVIITDLRWLEHTEDESGQAEEFSSTVRWWEKLSTAEAASVKSLRTLHRLHEAIVDYVTYVLERGSELPSQRVRPNPFFARPPATTFKGKQMGGVTSHPGFHTSPSIDVVMPYAQAKVEHDFTGDYPVILGFDMGDIEYYTDYDAEQMFENIRTAFQYNSGDSLASFEGFLEAADVLAEREFDSDDEPLFELTPGAIGSYILFARAGGANDKPDWKFANYVRSLANERDQREVWTGLRDRMLLSETLADALEQRRYLEDVDESRLKVVIYMQPVWPLMRIPFVEENETATKMFIANLEDNGFMVYTTDQVEDAYLPDPGMEVVWGKNKGELQYHGTTYLNLLAAAPSFKRRLPKPPSPFDRSVVDFATEALEYVIDEMANPEVEYHPSTGAVTIADE